MPKYPDVILNVTGVGLNLVFLLSRANAAMRRAALADETMRQFRSEFVSAELEDQMTVMQNWFTVVGDIEDYDNYKPE